MADEVELVVDRLAGDRHAHHHVGGVGEAAEHGLQRGEQDGEERRAARRAGLAERSVEAAIEPRRVSGAGEGAERRPRPVYRQVGQRRQVGELAGPPGKVLGARVLGLRLHRRVVGEARRRCEVGGRVGARRAIERGEIVQHDVHRPTVADDVMCGEDQHMAVHCQPHERGTDERAVPQVEGSACIDIDQPGQSGCRIGLVREVAHGKVEREVGREVHALARAVDMAAQRLVARHDCVQRCREGRRVDFAHEFDTHTLVEGTGSIVTELGGRQDLELRLGERR